jgi:hypothetical protein
VAMGRRHIGRHVQMMARFCSMIVHMVELISTKKSVSTGKACVAMQTKEHTSRIRGFGRE